MKKNSKTPKLPEIRLSAKPIRSADEQREELAKQGASARAKATAVAATVNPVNPVNPVQNSPADIAGALTTQYQAVVAATGQMLREAVKFGAMLMELETIVGKSQGGRNTDGDGIKGWLAEHCPEINYKTATVYKSLAAKSATLIGGMGLQVVAALQGGEKVTKTDGEVIDVPAEIIEKRDKLFAECDSRRKLEQAYFAFMSEGQAQPKAKKKAAKKVASGEGLSMGDSATMLWAGAMRVFEENRAAFHSAARDLRKDVAGKFLEELKMLVGALEERVGKK